MRPTIEKTPIRSLAAKGNTPIRDRESESATPAPGTKKKGKEKSANWPWNDATNKAMIDSFIESKNCGMQNGPSWKDEAWDNACIAVDLAQVDKTAPPMTRERLTSKWQTIKKVWNAYCAHYGSPGHCSGWTSNRTTENGVHREYPEIEPGVLVHDRETMKAHYKKHKECFRFKTRYPKNMEAIGQLLGDRLADGRSAKSIHAMDNDSGEEDDEYEDGDEDSPSRTSASPSPSRVSNPRASAKPSKLGLRKAVLTSALGAKDTGFRQLAMALSQPRVIEKGESIMAKAMKRAENLEIFKGNPEVLMSVNEVFFQDDRKADQFCHWPESLMEKWIEKEFGGTVIIDPLWKTRQAEKERQLANTNRTGIGIARREKQRERERRKAAMENVSASDEDEEEGDTTRESDEEDVDVYET